MMRGLILVLLAGLAAAAPLNEVAPGFDEAYPEEVPGLFEGDIELQPGDDPFHRNAVGRASQRWPNGVLPYEIQSNYPSVVKQIFMSAMHEIEERTKVHGKTCIHFKPHAGETAYLRFKKGTGCHTPVGYNHRESGVTIGSGCERKGTVMHELLHALGFWHEQSRTDRDSYVRIHLDNVSAGHERNFVKYDPPTIDLQNEPYDYGSIMHYGAYAFAKDRSKMTIEPLQHGVVIGQRVRLSDIDVQEIQILYGCIPKLAHPVTSGPGHTVGFVTAPPGTMAPVAGADQCTFDHGLCTWTQSHSDQTDWRALAGRTPSSSTGPSADHFGVAKAKYIYVEASGHKQQTAKLDSKSYPGGDYCIEFYYHMYGADIGALKLNVISGSHVYHLRSYSGNHGDHWLHQRMTAHVHTSGTFKFEFEATTGANYHSDIAIDDITVHSGNC